MLPAIPDRLSKDNNQISSDERKKNKTDQKQPLTPDNRAMPCHTIGTPLPRRQAMRCCARPTQAQHKKEARSLE